MVARYAARVNGVTDFVLTKLDVLTGWEQIPVCVAYDVAANAAHHARAVRATRARVVVFPVKVIFPT